MALLPTRSKEFRDMLEVAKLRGLFLQGNMTISAMANELGRSRKSVERKLNRMGLRSPSREAVTYTEEFKATVIAYYYATNRKETCEKFGISDRVIEGFISRKNKRLGLTSVKKKNEWTTEETLILLRYIGLKSIPFIAMKLDKTESAVNSYLKRRGYRLRYVNGLPQSIFEEMFSRTKELPFMRTVEGEVFIPWSTFEDNLGSISKGDEFQILIVKAMAKFQRFLHGVRNNTDLKEELILKIEE